MTFADMRKLEVLLSSQELQLEVTSTATLQNLFPLHIRCFQTFPV